MCKLSLEKDVWLFKNRMCFLAWAVAQWLSNFLGIQIPVLSAWTKRRTAKVLSAIDMNVMCATSMLLLKVCFLIDLLTILYCIENETSEKNDM